MAQEIADSKLLNTWGSSGRKIEPDISKIIEGWQLGEQPPHEYMNWLQNTFGSKLNHILKNGIASWNNETQYLVGSSVQHNGNVWICETTNTNSEPTDLNANWERLAINKDLTVTVDTLADLRSISYPANTVWASGYHTKNDGAFGSHIFRLKGVKTTEVDNSGTIIVATIGGIDYVYELQYDGAVNVKWFGLFSESNFNNAKLYSTSANKTLLIDGVFDLDFSIDFLENTIIEITGSSILNVTGVQSTIFNFNKNSKLIGNGAKINISNSSWDGVVLNCEADRITHLSNIMSCDLNLVSTHYKGAAIMLSSNTAAYTGLNFNLFSNIKYKGFNYGITLTNPVAAGNGWINSNSFINCISLGNKKALYILNNNVNGEITANTFTNCDIQTGIADTQIYIYNSNQNDFSGFIWDWNYASGNPIILDGTSSFNIINSNIDMDKITGSSNNKCFAYSGAESGLKVYQDVVVIQGELAIGTVGQSKVHPITINPETSGTSRYTIDNISGILRIYQTGSGVTDTLQLSSTNLFVGNSTTNTLNTKLKVKGVSNRHAMSIEAGTDGFYGIGFLNSAGITSGAITINTSSVVYATSSDYRLKEDLKPIENAIGKLMKLKPVNFAWKADNARVDGFIAHELQEVIPEAVTGIKDGMRIEEIELSPFIPAILDENGNIVEDEKEAIIEYKEVPDYQGIDQSKLVPILTASLQEAIERIEALEKIILVSK